MTSLRVYLPHLDELQLSADQSMPGHLRRLAKLSAKGAAHSIAETPDVADVVLFSEGHLLPDWRLRPILNHPLRKLYPKKCYVYDERDQPWPALPGVYVSAPRREFDHRFQAAWCYIAGGRNIVPPEFEARPDLLFSFVGSPTASCRENIFRLTHPRAVVQRSEGFMFYDESAPNFSQREAFFRLILSRSKYVLCPRGQGTSSFRLYEVLASGRVPVIISDQWVPPRQVPWETCSLRWPENRIDALPAYLETQEEHWSDLARNARRVYEEWFAPNVAFQRLVDCLVPMTRSQRPSSFSRKGRRTRTYYTLAARDLRRHFRG